jgi:murein L,D-transpeptidase YafK
MRTQSLNTLSRRLIGVGVGLVGLSFILPMFTQVSGNSSQAALLPRTEIDTTGGLKPDLANDMTEAALASIYVLIASGNTQQALKQTDALLQQYPNFRLAHLIRGDLLMSRTRPITGLGSTPNAPADRLNALRSEALKRLEAIRSRPPEGFLPSYALQLRQDQKHLVVADMTRSRLYLFIQKNGQLKLLDDIYISQGKEGFGKEREGDQRTPIGVYQTTSLIPSEKLDDFYGAGALPINYPNDFDRRHGRTGHGIWLHGVPADTYSRTPLASDGCVVLANPDMAKLMQTVAPRGTPVLITRKIEWVSQAQIEKERRSLKNAIENWRNDWQSRNHSRYAQHYDLDFKSDIMSRKDWLARKQAVNQNKSWIKIQLQDLSIFKYPGQQQLAVVEFTQDYASSNLNSVSSKRMYWIKRGEEWKILIEDNA